MMITWRHALKSVGVGLAITCYFMVGLPLSHWLLGGTGVAAFLLFTMATSLGLVFFAAERGND